ncbi:MAG TPA: DUF2905 domain-containing protein [Planctomycetota bacterium]|nr:DUF2905 domain-containing protein [Planctomycetota bacterium]
MDPGNALAKGLILFGLFITIAGVVLLFAGRIPYLGRLPGDIRIERENFSFYFPLATSLILSVVLSLGLWLLSRFHR